MCFPILGLHHVTATVDGHIPKERVIESERVFSRLGARVKRTLYPGMGHLVNDDEFVEVPAVLDEVLAAP
jgi:predicted esterase